MIDAGQGHIPGRDKSNSIRTKWTEYEHRAMLNRRQKLRRYLTYRWYPLAGRYRQLFLDAVTIQSRSTETKDHFLPMQQLQQRPVHQEDNEGLDVVRWLRLRPLRRNHQSRKVHRKAGTRPEASISEPSVNEKYKLIISPVDPGKS